MIVDLFIIVLLMLLNGFFAMSELALVSARRARLLQIAEDKKSSSARLALKLSEDPTSYLSVIQVGVTLNTILAGAFSGATLAGPLGTTLNNIAWITPYGTQTAFFATVAIVGYLTLVIGELVPKRLALAHAETIAIRIAWIMQFLIMLMMPFVVALKFSTNIVLKLLRQENATDSAITEDEVKTMIAEGTEKGVFKQAEKEMLEGVMRLADWSVRTIMTPRMDMVWLCVDDTTGDNIREIRASGHSRFPLARGDMEEVIGIVYAKDLLDTALLGNEVDLKSLMREPLIVPDTTAVLRLLDLFRVSGQQLAIIIDEYGSVEGLVTATDILEAITGALPDYGQEGIDPPVQREDGSWLIDGMTPIDEVETIIGMRNLHAGGDYHTLAGFVLDRMGRIPTASDFFVWDDARFEVVDMDGRRIDKVMVSRHPTPDAITP